MKKFRITQLFIIFTMIAMVAPSTVSAAMKGSGTKDDPYLIATATDLQDFADMTNQYPVGRKTSVPGLQQT